MNIIAQLGKLNSLSGKDRNAVNYARFGQQGANLAAIFERSIVSGRWSEILSNDDSRYSFISRSAQ
ncbi:MAG: hypothetical protein QM523_02605 [Candidatus Pacebacteria bacterium]|nr:hypothetical protein [Candidatus Paceibacterota bacterium]